MTKTKKRGPKPKPKYDGTPLMTTADVARYLNLSPKTVAELARAGRLRASRLAGRWRFRKEDVDALIEQRSAEGKKDLIILQEKNLVHLAESSVDATPLRELRRRNRKRRSGSC